MPYNFVVAVERSSHKMRRHPVRKKVREEKDLHILKVYFFAFNNTLLKVMKVKRKKLILIGIITAVAAVIICLVTFLWQKGDKNCFSKGLASKMLALLDEDKSIIESASDCFNSDNPAWYEKYMNYLYAYDLLDETENKPNKRTAGQAWTYGDFKYYFARKEISAADVYEVTGIDIDEKRDGKYVSKGDFMEIYEYLVALYGSTEGVHTESFVLCGTPANIENAESWQAYTSDGQYGFEGLALDRYMDCEIMVYVRGSEIISVVLKITDEVTYHNVWLEKGEKNILVAHIGSAGRTFYVDELSMDFGESIGDISMKQGKVTGITLKQDTINGKVLTVNKDKIEIEGYGEIPVEENFKVYKNYGVIEEQNISDILVGYNLTDFVVAEGKICAAIISRDLHADNIRVMIMTTGFTSLFHERVSVTGTKDFEIKYGDKSEKFAAGDIVDIYKGCTYLESGRITITSSDSAGMITVLTVEKSYGNPSYSGTIEINEYDEGLTIINDVPLEEYLYAVVPSEMPASFGVEALKVQAVCARSYAYRQLLNNAYSMYGAHVDDSTNFQVYNNSKRHEDATQAVRETYGQVVSYNGNTVSTYYYSTSCGISSDVSLWNSNTSGMPFLVTKSIDSEGKKVDLSNESDFRKYIKSTDPDDYDYGFGYYRWNVTMSIEDLTNSINNNIFARYCATPDKVQVLQNGSWVSKEVRAIGTLQKIEVTKRTKAGGILEIILYGTENTVKVTNELSIRYLFDLGNNPLNVFGGGTVSRSMLPSTNCIFETIEENGKITGYKITGGGNGHGIGVSQNAVFNMVKSGMKYDDILMFFYEGTDITNVYSD